MKIITLVVGMVSTNCYIVYDEMTGEAAIIDPGDDFPLIDQTVKPLRLDVRKCFVTHGHFDHIMAVERVQKEYKTKVVIRAEDAACLTSASASLLTMARLGQPFRACEPDIILKGGEITKVGEATVDFIHTPGHTPGSMCIRMDNVLFTGDTLFEGDCGRTDLPGGDRGQMESSLRKLYRLEDDYIIYPGHDVPTTLGMERDNNRDMLKACGKL